MRHITLPGASRRETWLETTLGEPGAAQDHQRRPDTTFVAHGWLGLKCVNSCVQMEPDRGPREGEAPSLTAADRIAAMAHAGCAGAIALGSLPIAHQAHGAGQG